MRTTIPRLLAALFAALALLLPADLVAQTAESLVGSWTFEQETPRGTMVHTLTFVHEDGAWAGSMASERRSFDLEEVTFEEGRLTFAFQPGPPPGRGGQGRMGGAQGQDRQSSGGAGGPPSGDGERPPSVFEGVLDGDTITGEMKGPRGSMPLVLTRKQG